MEVKGDELMMVVEWVEGDFMREMMVKGLWFYLKGVGFDEVDMKENRGKVLLFEVYFMGLFGFNSNVDFEECGMGDGLG